MLLTAHSSCRVMLMSVGQIVERGLFELMKGAGHHVCVTDASASSKRRRHCEGERRESRLWALYDVSASHASCAWRSASAARRVRRPQPAASGLPWMVPLLYASVRWLGVTEK